MKLIKFEPSVCKEGKVFSGHVMIEALPYPVRLKYIKDCNFKVANKDGEMVVEKSMDNVDSVIKIIELGSPHVKKIEILKYGEVVYKNFDDMLTDSDCDELNIEICGAVVKGTSLGKN